MKFAHLIDGMMMQENSEATRERVREANKIAIAMMRKAGFEIGEGVQVVVDPQLPFMGYTIPQGSGFRIVVSGMAVDSGMLEALLVHEMSHVYRMRTHHPSHDGRIIQEVVSGLGKRGLSQDYHQKILSGLVNDIQDLYADDIATKVIKKGGFLRRDQLTVFLQDWVKDEPVESNDAEMDRWVNSSIMVHNARAIGQMARHEIEDTGDKAATSNKRYLSRISPILSSQFEYFKGLMANLKENITEEEYRRLLTDYLNRFLEIAG